MKNKILFILSLFFGLMFINAGLNKFFYYMPVPDDMPADTTRMFAAMLEIGWLLPLIAVAEIAGGLLFIIPRTRALGAVVIAPVLAGLIVVHFSVAREGLPMLIAMLAVYGWVIFEDRNKFYPMVR